MKTSIKGYDWVKAAAQVVVDDHEVERAFMDQSYGMVANKCGALMQDPNRLGFEVVYKNDSNTRMIGIHAFRVDSNLLYVPVFFISGTIKGSDLLYRHSDEKFNPNTKEWIRYIMETSGSRKLGRGIDKKDLRKIKNNMNLEQLAYPTKSASYGFVNYDTVETKQASGEDGKFKKGKWFVDGKAIDVDWREVLEKMAVQLMPEPILKKYILKTGGLRAVEAIIDMMEKSAVFADALARSVSDDDWMPPELPRLEKAAAPKPVVSIYFEPRNDMEQFAKRGFEINDERAEDYLNVVYSKNTDRMDAADRTGMYDVLMRDGSKQKAFVVPFTEDNMIGDNSCGLTACPDFREEHGWQVIIPGKEMSRKVKLVYGEPLDDKPPGKDTMSTGNAYVVFDKALNTVSEPFLVKSKSTNDGVTEYEICAYWEGNCKSLIHNPDYKHTKFREGIVGSDAAFIEVGFDKEDDMGPGGAKSINYKRDLAVGDNNTLHDWVMNVTPAKKASISTDELGLYKVSLGKSFRQGLSAKQASFHLLKGLGIGGSTVLSLLDSADKEGKVEFTVWPSEKRAASLRLLDEPEMQNGYDDNFGVPVEYNHDFAVPSERDERQHDSHRIGAAWDPTMGGNTNNGGSSAPSIMDMSPEQIAQYAGDNKLPNVFEHGVIGNLTQTFDSGAQIDNYLDDMEVALDRLGRSLFLFYWKPADFEIRYGSDDMQQMENQILSNFKSFGTLVLNLLKKSSNEDVNLVSVSN